VTPGLRPVLFFLGGLYLLLAGLGGVLQWMFGEVGLALIQLGLLLIPALLFVSVGGFDPIEPAALILMAGAIPLAWFLAWAQSQFIEVPTELFEAMSAFLQADGLGRFLWLLLLVALLPAVAEEVVFRGVVLSALRPHVARTPAILLNGLLFGLFHWSPQTAFRFLPTAWLGVILAWVVWETRSIWVGVLLHFLNNALVVTLSVLPATQEWASDADRPPPLWVFPLAVALLALGGVYLARPRNTEAAGAPSPET